MSTRSSPAIYDKLLIAMLLLLFSSCGGNILGPLNDTVFVLRTIDGDSLPAVTFQELVDRAWVVVADTIWFESGSRWRRHWVQRREEGVDGAPRDVVENGYVERQNGELILWSRCFEACRDTDVFKEGGTDLVMDHTLKHGGRNMIFKRI